MYAWGFGDDGQLGAPESTLTVYRAKDESVKDLIMGDRASYASVPVALSLPSTVHIVMVSAGSRHSLALDINGSVYSWGWGERGQLGHGTLDTVAAPTVIHSLAASGVVVVDISAGGFHSALLTSSGDILTCGGARYGQLGHAADDSAADDHCASPRPVDFPSGTLASGDSWVAVSCGGNHSGCLSRSGAVYTWGRGDSGQLGVSDRWRSGVSLPDPGTCRPDRVIFEVEGSDSEPVAITQISLGAFHTGCVDSKGRLWTFGKEDYGTLGYTVEDGDQHYPRLVEGLLGERVLSVSCGGWHTVALCASGVFTFGRGEFGRLGHGDTKGRLSPTKVDSLARVDVVAVSAGGSHTCILSREGRVYTFGRGDHGRLGIASKANSYVPVMAHFQADSLGEIRSPVNPARKLLLASGGEWFYSVDINQIRSAGPGSGASGGPTSAATATMIGAASTPVLAPAPGVHVTCVSAGGAHTLALARLVG